MKILIKKYFINLQSHPFHLAIDRPIEVGVVKVVYKFRKWLRFKYAAKNWVILEAHIRKFNNPWYLWEPDKAREETIILECYSQKFNENRKKSINLGEFV